MALKNYGVLKGHVMDRQLATSSNSHYQVHVIDHTTDYRIAINVFSKLSPSELLFYLDENFDHPVLEFLEPLNMGFNHLNSQAGGAALDFVRGHYFDPSKMKAMPFSATGPDNDLNEKLDRYILQAMEEADALVYAFGERWGPEDKKDRYFGFTPGNGIHDIHMNQGNDPQFAKDDGVWQDGALLFYFPSREQWVGCFLAFQSQSWDTDDSTGHTKSSAAGPGTQPTSDSQPATSDIQIIAALVNPFDDDEGKESLTLINRSPSSVPVKDWVLVDQNSNQLTLNDITIAPGECLRIVIPKKTIYLSNKGGTITLKNSSGQKVHGVSYSKNQASKSGWTILFK